jgi:hypothetical protein
MNDTIEKPGIDERLAQAVNSSNLVPTRMNDGECAIGPLEVLAAAGWTGRTAAYVLGRALIALESEWDSSEQPRVPREHDIQALISVLPSTVNVFDDEGQLVRDAAGNVKTIAISARERKAAGRAQAEDWYEQERVRLIARLRTLPMARGALVAWALQQGIASPESKSLSMLSWWLDHRCPKCMGTMLDPAPLGGRGAVRVCKSCNGTGERHLPFDDHRCKDGRIMERAMIDSKHRAMQKMKRFTSRMHRA